MDTFDETGGADPGALIATLRERARELGLEADDEEALLEAVLQHDVRIPEPDEAECRRYYARHADLLRIGAVIEADHILFALTPSTPIDALRARAEEALAALLERPDDFAECARTLSNCPSARLGGNLGQLTAGQCVPEFWQALTEHGRPGLLPRLVRTRFGLHIVRIARIDPGFLPPFDQLRGQIERTLGQQSLVRALRLYAGDLARQAGIPGAAGARR